MKKLISLNALVIENDPNILKVLRYNLETKGHKVEIAKTQEEAYSLLDKSRFDFVILNLRLSKHDPMDGADIETGFDALRYIRSKYTKEKLPVMVMTASGDEDTVVRALTKEGANAYVKKPFHENKEPLEDKIAGIVAFILTQREGKRGRMKSAESKSIIGKDPKLIEAIALARRVAQGDSSVVILGETGTGKELLAREIHDSSPRRNANFEAINCTAIPGTLFESELFGHEKGAFTGATESRPGKFELANHGTLFLDEIGDMPINQQPKFLRVLDNHEVSRVGSNKTKKIDFRLIAATNKKLLEMVDNNQFREDLFYRIHVMFISLPPLRERKDDIPALVRHFLSKHKGDSKNISREAMEKLKGYNWPGNVRELDSVMQRALMLCKGKTVSAADIRFDMRSIKTELKGYESLPLNDRQKSIYSYIKEKGKITNREARTLLKVSGKTVNRDLTAMVNMGVIKKDGIGRGISYVLKIDSQKKETSNGKEIGPKEGKGAGINGEHERILAIQKHAEAFGGMEDLAKEMIEKGVSVEEAIKKFNGKRRKELITIFAKKWEDYSMAVRGWADPILRRIE